MAAALAFDRAAAGADGVDAVPVRPLDVLARVTGADRAVPWAGAATAATCWAAAWVLASPLLAKLVAALLVPVLLGWIAGRVAPRVSGGRHWAVAWAWAALVLALGVMGALIVRKHASAPRDLVAFTAADIVLLATLAWTCTLAVPLAVLQRQAYLQELAALRLSALGAELKALQAQVEPHFLYNTLANTRYLARHHPERAVDMLDHLIAYLHQALPDMRSRTSNVERECALAGHYLALMAIRFGDRLRYTVDVAPDVAGADLPPLLLMSLVENAVRHGVEPMPGTVTVMVRATREGATLRLDVVDDGPGPGQSGVTGNGVGLRNATDRLRALYGDAARFTLERGGDARTRAALVLPLLGLPEHDA